MAVLFPLGLWFISAALRVAAVLCALRVLSGAWVSEPMHIFVVSLPFCLEVMALLGTPSAPDNGLGDSRASGRHRSFMVTELEERRNNMRANLVYLLLPGPITLIAYLVTLFILRGGFPQETAKTLLWTSIISAAAWFVASLVLGNYGPEYGPPPETSVHTHSDPPPKASDVSRTEGMEPDAPEDVW